MNFYEAFADELEKIALENPVIYPTILTTLGGATLGAGLGYGGARLLGAGKKGRYLAAITGGALGGLGGAIPGVIASPFIKPGELEKGMGRIGKEITKQFNVVGGKMKIL